MNQITSVWSKYREGPLTRLQRTKQGNLSPKEGDNDTVLCLAWQRLICYLSEADHSTASGHSSRSFSQVVMSCCLALPWFSAISDSML